MNRKLFNLKNAAIVAVFSLIAFVGLNSFKSMNTEQNMAVLKWYTITTPPLGDPNSQADQHVTPGSISEPPPINDEGCATLNTGIPCAVRLSVPTELYILPSGFTVEALPSGVTFSTYAREPEPEDL